MAKFVRLLILQWKQSDFTVMVFALIHMKRHEQQQNSLEGHNLDGALSEWTIVMMKDEQYKLSTVYYLLYIGSAKTYNTLHNFCVGILINMR